MSGYGANNMPQLDFSVFPSQLFWLIVSFFLMLFIMSKFIIPKTSEMINLRKDKINGDLEKASEIKIKVEETLDKYNKSLQDANNRASLSLQKTKDELEDMINCKHSDLMFRLQSEIETGEEKIALSKDKALENIEDLSVELSIQILNKLGFSGVKSKDARAVIKNLKKEL